MFERERVVFPKIMDAFCRELVLFQAGWLNCKISSGFDAKGSSGCLASPVVASYSILIQNDAKGYFWLP